MRTARGTLAVWPPLPLGTHAHRPVPLPFPLGDPGALLVARARHGLYLGVQALGLAPGDEVLAPAYHHGSEVEALQSAGLMVKFYEVTDSLAPDESELDALVGPRTRALYLIHYLGFPQSAARWRRWCDGRGLLLLEDAAQAWLAGVDGAPVGGHGDLAIFCLYKTYGLPDGAVVRLRNGPLIAALSPAAGWLPLVRRHGAWVAGRSAAVASLLAWRQHDEPYRPDDDFALGDPQAPAAASQFLIRRLPTDAAAARRAHYRALLAGLSDSVSPPFAEVPDGASPFAFPLTTDNKGELLDRLRRAGVHALDFWSVPHPSLPAGRFPGAAARRASTVALPVHQELRTSDVERIAAAARGRPVSPPSLEWFDHVDPARGDWDRLATASGNVFATWLWASRWWHHYGRGGRLLLAALRRPGGERRALLPLVVWRDGPVRVARFLGYGTADELGPVCAPRDRPAAARAVRRVLADADVDVLLGEHLPARDGWAAMLGGGAVLRREGFPLLRAPEGWAGYLPTRSSHFRHKIAGLERRLGRHRDLRYRLADDPARLDQDLDRLFDLHRARWARGSEFLAHEEFHRDMAQAAFHQGWLRLWFLELDGVAVAAWYGFRFAGVESHFQSGRDPRLERESPGTLLLAHTIKAALDDGVTEYRFLRGGEAYKQRFATDDPGLETVAIARGALGRSALAGVRAVDAVPQLRRLLRSGVA